MLVFDVSAIRYGAGVGDRAEQAMAGRVAEFEVVGPWSLETSRRFWEGFTPAALAPPAVGGESTPRTRPPLRLVALTHAQAAVPARPPPTRWPCPLSAENFPPGPAADCA